VLATTDLAFMETHAIKQHKSSLNPDFVELVNWISSVYNVEVLNVHYDFINPSGEQVPRLDIILESEQDLEKFRDGEDRFVTEISDLVSNKFSSIVFDKQLEYQTENLMVIFSSFVPIAKSYVNTQMVKLELDRLINEVELPVVWKIQNYFGKVTIFLFTDEQVEKHAQSSWIKDLKLRYFEVLKVYDTFGYFDTSQTVISIDSKENFDNNYNSSWFLYYS